MNSSDSVMPMNNQRESIVEQVVGRRVAALRRARDWSQAELGERLAAFGLPMTQPVVWKLERGQRPLRVSEVDALARIFDLPLVAMLDTTGDMAREETLSERVRLSAAGAADARLRVEQQEARVAAESARLAALRAELADAEELAAGDAEMLGDHFNGIPMVDLSGSVVVPPGAPTPPTGGES